MHIKLSNNKKINFLKLLFLTFVILSNQNITCFAELPCENCCLIPGQYDSQNGGWFYKYKGGLRQVQVLNRGYTETSAGNTYEEALAKMNRAVNSALKYAYSVSDCIPCLTYPPIFSPSVNFPLSHITGPVFGDVLSNNSYYVISRPPSVYVQCNDNSIDTDGDGIVDCSDNCPWIPNPDQADCNNNGKGNLCDCDINLQVSKNKESTKIQTNGCTPITWIVTHDPGVNFASESTSNSIAITPSSGPGYIYVTAQSANDVSCIKSVPPIYVGCKPCLNGNNNCLNTDLNKNE